MLITTIRAIALILAGGCFYIGLFTYEDERRGIQNRLEELWIKIDDRSKKEADRNRSFFKGIIGIVSLVLEMTFGNSREYGYFCSVSACISLLGIFLYSVLWKHLWEGMLDWHFAIWSVGSLIVCIIVGITYALPRGFKSATSLWYSGSLLLAISAAQVLTHSKVLKIFLFTSHGWVQARDYWIEFLVVLAVSIAADWVLVASNRALLRSFSTLSYMFRCISMIFFNFITMSLIIGFNLGLMHASQNQTAELRDRLELATYGNLLMQANLGTLLIATMILSGCTFLMIHRLAWPFLARPVYSLHSNSAVSNKKFLLAVGSALLVAAGIPDNFVELVGSFK